MGIPAQDRYLHHHMLSFTAFRYIQQENHKIRFGELFTHLKDAPKREDGNMVQFAGGLSVGPAWAGSREGDR